MPMVLFKKQKASCEAYYIISQKNSVSHHRSETSKVQMNQPTRCSN